MSAFEVEKATIDKVVTMLYADKLSSTDCAQLDAVGLRLWEMNHLALKARYGADEPHGVKYEHQVPKGYYSHNPPTLAVRCAMLKAANCFLYQCSEGDVPELALYCEVAKARHDLALAIVSDLPEYEAAPWE